MKCLSYKSDLEPVKDKLTACMHVMFSVFFFTDGFLKCRIFITRETNVNLYQAIRIPNALRHSLVQHQC